MRSDGNICQGTAPAGTTVLHELTFKTLDALDLCAKKNLGSVFASYFPKLEVGSLRATCSESSQFYFHKILKVSEQ